jgi:cytidylate kinase
MPDSKREHLPLRVEHRLEAQITLADRLKSRGTKEQPPAPFITIARQYGCEAMTLAEELAARMPDGPWPVYNRQVFEKMAEEEHISLRLFDALDVHVRSGIEEFFQGLLGRSPTDLRMLHHLVRTVRALATLGHCIIVGRGAPVLTAGLAGGIHVRLIAPNEWRERNLIQRFGWSKEQALEVLHEEQHGRHNFFRKYLNQDANNPELYDLMLNVARLTRPEQIGSIMALYRERSGA